MMKAKHKNLILLIALLVFLTACTPSNNETPVGGQAQTPGIENRLANTRWKLTSFGPQTAETPVIEGTELTLGFDGNVKAGGFSGCNTFQAEYAVTNDNQISIDEIIATEIACTAEGVMEQELQYYEALRTANRYEISGDTLTIWYGDGQSALKFSRITGSTPVPVTPSPVG